MVGTPGRAEASQTGGAGTAETLAVAPSPLVLISQTPWVTQGQTFDLHLRARTPVVPAAELGVSVSVYSCLSSVSAFDQSLVSTASSAPVSSTSSPLAVSGLASLPQAGFDLSMPVVVGGSGGSAGSGSSASSFTIHLVPVSEQCQSFPAGVYPVRIQLVDLSNNSVLGSITTHLVYSESPGGTQRLRVAVVLPVQVTQRASPSPSPTELLARPSSALATPPDDAVTAVAATVAAIATQHPSVPLTMQVSGQTIDLLTTTSHQVALAQLGQLATSPDIHQFTSAPFTPVNASVLVNSGLSSELGLQVASGAATLSAATERPASSATSSLGAWIADDGLDPNTVGALAADGFRQAVVPASSVTGAPTDGSTPKSFALPGARGSQLMALSSNDDLTARFSSNPGNPVLAAHQLVAELAQLYYERPNASTARGVFAVAPSTWVDNPAFVDALLGSLDGSPVVQSVTTSQLFALFPTPASCRPICRSTSTTTAAGLPVTAIRAQRARIDGFAGAVGSRPLIDQLGNLVLGGESLGLRPPQQAAVLANTGSALDAQLGQFAVEGNQTVTLTASSGLIPVTIVSVASYPMSGSLVLSSDKLLFPNGETQWTSAVTLLPHHSNVVYVRVRTRTSGVFRLAVVLRAPDGTLRLAIGELSVRSTSSSLVGVVLTAGAMAVLVAWWVRTSLKRRKLNRAGDKAEARP